MTISIESSACSESPLIKHCAAIVFVALAACAGRTPVPELWKEVSGDNAMAHVKALVAFGPRPPDSEAIEQSRKYMTEQLQHFGWSVIRQEFTRDTPRGSKQFVNLIARFGDGARPSFLLCSHYDTKTFDTGTFVGANDGGSSSGLLVELARVFAKAPKLAARLELVLFDGEEAYEAFTETDGLYGSRYFAKQLASTGEAKQFRGGILFDMIGDSSLDVTLPPDSPADLAAGIFASADALHARHAFTYFRGGILDDHTPLNEIGVPTIDLIDFNYPPWHTVQDTIDKLSPESLRIVGAVATHFLVTRALK
jgi:glutaminyl-peptide cyclotransferase